MNYISEKLITKSLNLADIEEFYREIDPNFNLNEAAIKDIGKDTKKRYKNYIAWHKKSEKILEKKGINTKKLSNDIKKVVATTSSKLKLSIKSNDIDEGTKNITEGLSKISQIFKEVLEVNEIKIGESIVLLILVILVSSLLSNLAVAAFGIETGIIITTVVVAPLSEEYGKYLAIKNEADGSFLFVFNLVEFFSYLSSLFGSPIKAILKFGLVRGAAVLMHYVTTFFQKYFSYNNKTNDPTLVGYGIGVFIHGLWNYMAITKWNKPLQAWISK